MAQKSCIISHIQKKTSRGWGGGGELSSTGTTLKTDCRDTTSSTCTSIVVTPELRFKMLKPE